MEEKLITRKEYKEFIEKLNEGIKKTKGDGFSRIFGIRGNGGTGKSSLNNYIVDYLRDPINVANELGIEKLNDLNIGCIRANLDEKSFESSNIPCVDIFLVLLRYICVLDKTSTKLILKLWNKYAEIYLKNRFIDEEEFNNSNKEKILKDIISDAVSYVIPFSSTMIDAFDIGQNKKNEKILSANYEDELKEIYRSESSINTIIDRIIEKANEILVQKNVSLIFIIDNAETIVIDSKYINADDTYTDLKKLFSRLENVVFIFSGREEFDKEKLLFKRTKTIVEDTFDLSGYNIEDAMRLVEEYAINIDGQPLTEDDVIRLLNSTENNPLWITKKLEFLVDEYGLSLKRITRADFEDAINSTNKEIMLRLFGINNKNGIEKIISDSTINKNAKMMLLYLFVPNSSTYTYSEIASRLKKYSFEYDRDNEVYKFATFKDQRIKMHKEVIKVLNDFYFEKCASLKCVKELRKEIGDSLLELFSEKNDYDYLYLLENFLYYYCEDETIVSLAEHLSNTKTSKSIIRLFINNINKLVQLNSNNSQIEHSDDLFKSVISYFDLKLTLTIHELFDINKNNYINIANEKIIKFNEINSWKNYYWETYGYISNLNDRNEKHKQLAILLSASYNLAGEIRKRLLARINKATTGSANDLNPKIVYCYEWAIDNVKELTLSLKDSKKYLEYRNDYINFIKGKGHCKIVGDNREIRFQILKFRLLEIKNNIEINNLEETINEYEKCVGKFRRNIERLDKIQALLYLICEFDVEKYPTLLSTRKKLETKIINIINDYISNLCDKFDATKKREFSKLFIKAIESSKKDIKYKGKINQAVAYHIRNAISSNDRGYSEVRKRLVDLLFNYYELTNSVRELLLTFNSLKTSFDDDKSIYNYIYSTMFKSYLLYDQENQSNYEGINNVVDTLFEIYKSSNEYVGRADWQLLHEIKSIALNNYDVNEEKLYELLEKVIFQKRNHEEENQKNAKENIYLSAFVVYLAEKNHIDIINKDSIDRIKANKEMTVALEPQRRYNLQLLKYYEEVLPNDKKDYLIKKLLLRYDDKNVADIIPENYVTDYFYTKSFNGYNIDIVEMINEAANNGCDKKQLSNSMVERLLKDFKSIKGKTIGYANASFVCRIIENQIKDFDGEERNQEYRNIIINYVQNNKENQNVIRNILKITRHYGYKINDYFSIELLKEIENIMKDDQIIIQDIYKEYAKMYVNLGEKENAILYFDKYIYLYKQSFFYLENCNSNPIIERLSEMKHLFNSRKEMVAYFKKQYDEFSSDERGSIVANYLYSEIEKVGSIN